MGAHGSQEVVWRYAPHCLQIVQRRQEARQGGGICKRCKLPEGVDWLLDWAEGPV